MQAEQKVRVEKLLGLLSSDFDGERATAAKKIAQIAGENRMSLVELMKSCFGGAQPSRSDAPRWSKPRAERTTHAKIVQLALSIKAKGHTTLTGWEREFATDIMERCAETLTDKQEKIVDRILAKLAIYEPANF